MLYHPVTRNNIFSGVDSIFDAFARSKMTKTAVATTTPRANVSKDDGGYQIFLAAPGLSRSDFNIEVDNDVITISAKVESQDSENELRQEYSYNSFSRSWTLPENVNLESISAQYEAGVLNLNIPIDEVNINQTKKIEVN